MKKKWFVFLILGIFLMFSIKSIHAIGLRPAIVEFNFVPGEVVPIEYYVYEENPEREIEISADGELAQYVELSKTNITGGGSFTATIKLPSKIETPGKNRISISVKEKPVEGGGIGTLTSIGGAVYIIVPYPGKYAELKELFAEDVNEGENLVFKAKVASLGEEEIFAKINAELFLYDGRKIEEFEIGQGKVESQKEKDFEKIVNSSNYGAGYYNLTTTLDYGTERIIKKEQYFRIGTLVVDIANWTKEVYPNRLNKFDVEVESRWNNKIENVYAQVSLYDTQNESKVLTEFKTVSETLEKWQKKTLSGYLNTENIEPGIYKTNITLFFERGSSTKITEIKIIRGGALGALKGNIRLIAAVLLAILAIAVVFYFFRRRNFKKAR